MYVTYTMHCYVCMYYILATNDALTLTSLHAVGKTALLTINSFTLSTDPVSIAENNSSIPTSDKFLVGF